MRLIAFILSLVVLVLTCMPCADGNALTNLKVRTHLTTEKPQHHEHGNKDLCSPFCHCACCCTYSVVTTPFFLEQPTVVFSIVCHTDWLSQAILTIALPILQPPPQVA